MIGRKLVLIQNRQSLNEIPAEEDRQFEIHPYIKEVKYITIKNIKKYGHISLVETKIYNHQEYKKIRPYKSSRNIKILYQIL